MDGIDLRDLENRCIQEEAPRCSARCPIHVDVKPFLRKAASGAWDEAFQALAITMPLPGIVARICDHPCEFACLRSQAGGPIRISEIERTTARLGRIAKRRTPLPQKKRRVAVAGMTLSGLTVAWELGHKGYQVTLFEGADRFAGRSWGFDEALLPPEAVEEEMGVLRRIGVEISPAAKTNGRAWIVAALGEFDAVYAGLDAGGLLDRDALPEDCLPVDPLTLATSREALFLGGRDARDASFSPIGSVAEGRRAAISIDRFLQKVSLSAGREKEGVYETRLYTNLSGVMAEPPVVAGDASGYDATEATGEAKRCLQCECMECTKVCLYLERFESYPKRYVRQIAADATIVMGAHGKTSMLVNSCSLCGLCTDVCPHDLSMADVCMEGRRSLVERGKMPPSAHAFALDEMAAAMSEKAGLVSHGPGKEKSRFVFFPGCQMAAIYPEHVFSAYAFLRESVPDVGLMLRCCGVPAKWAARNDLFGDALAGLIEGWEALGGPSVIAACPTCYRTLKEGLPRAKIMSLWEVLAESPERFKATGAMAKLAVHDPCAARYEPGIRETVRKILLMLGHDVEELPLGGEKTECCGFGGLMAAANPQLARDVAKMRASRSDLDYVTYCAMCRSTLAASGKRSLYLPDLLFGSREDPALRRPPGLSDRRENRYRLKERLLKELWGKKGSEMEDHEKISLNISRDVRELMETRRILTEDVQKVIDHAQKAGASLLNPDTGHRLASFRPAHVTYWVEYSPGKEAFLVHNAYCHRMEIVEEKAS